MIVVLVGAPGSGKGTQAKPLSDQFGIAHLASGDLFRENIKNGTELGQLAQAYMDRGELVPDDVTIRMVLERMSRPDCAAGVILDGFPRTVAQAQALDAALSQAGKQVNVVPYIKVSDHELLRRLSGRWICRACGASYHLVSNPPKQAGTCDRDGGELYQRPDDTEDVALNRLKVYFQETTPALEYYQSHGLLVEINGEQGIDQVSHDLTEALKQGSRA